MLVVAWRGRWIAGAGLVVAACGSDDDDDGSRSVVDPSYREARTLIELGAGDSVGFEIRAGFDPDRVLGDPDVFVLQLNREDAVFEFGG